MNIEPNQWIGKLNSRNEAVTDLKGVDKTEYIKLKFGLYHGKGKRKKPKKK